MNLLNWILVVSLLGSCFAFPTGDVATEALAADEAIEAEPAEATEAPTTSTGAPVTGRKVGGKLPSLLMRASSGSDSEGAPKPVRKSDADLHEFLKRRRQERILATTEADPLITLKGKDVEQAPPAENKPSSGSFRSGKSRFSGASRKTETATTTTTTTTTVKPGRSAGGRFASSGAARKSSRGPATTEAPVVENVELGTEASAKNKMSPKRFFRKN